MIIIRRLLRHSAWKNTVILLAAQFALQGLILFWMYPKLGGSVAPLDMRSGLSLPAVAGYLASLGEQGRRLYALNECTLDLLFPLLYSLAYSFLFLRLLAPFAGGTSRWLLLSLLPFGIAAADLFENFSITGAIASYPAVDAWSRAVIVFNTVKGSLMAVTIASLFLVFAVRILARKRV